MKSTRKWIVVRIDGKIAGVSTDYRVLAKVTKHLAKCSDAPEKTGGSPIIYNEVSAIAAGIDEVWRFSGKICCFSAPIFRKGFGESFGN